MSLRKIGCLALSAVALVAITAGNASATTFEVGGSIRNEAIEFTLSHDTDRDTEWSTTGGDPINLCLRSHASVNSQSPFTGTSVTGPVSDLTFHTCGWSVTVEQAGTLSVEHISGTTNGTVRSAGTRVRVFYGALGLYLTCITGSGVDIGKLTGVASGNAMIHIDTVINCGFFFPTARWKGTYDITSPSGLGVLS